MARAGKINLITTVEASPELSGIYETLQRVTYGSLIAFISLGVIVGGIYLFVSARQQSLTAEKSSLTATVNQASVIQGLLATTKQRIAVIDRITAGQRHFGPLFAILQALGTAGQLSSLTVDDTNKTIVTMHIDSIENAIALVDVLIARANANTLTKPALASFALAKDGGFDMSVSFVPKL